MKQKYTLPLVLAISIIGGAVGYIGLNTETPKERLRRLISENPFSNPRRQIEVTLKGKPAAPDLAWEQDFIRTMDPALGRPVPERLPSIIQSMQSMRNMQLAPGGASTPWDERGPNNVGGRTRALAFSPSDPTFKKVWAAGVTGGLWFNNDITNANSSWNAVNNFWDNITVTCIAFDPNNSQIMYVGTGEGFGAAASRGAGIWKSTNGGTTWTQVSSSASFYYVLDIVVRNESGTSVVYAAVDGGFYNGVWHGASASGIQRSINGGTSWTNVSPNIPSSTTKLVAADLEIAADGRIWAGSKAAPFTTTDRGGGRIFYSDNGTSWTVSNSTTVTNGRGRVELACAPSNASVVYAVIENDLMVEAIKKTVNSGGTWTNANEPADVDQGIPDDDFSRGQAWYDLIMAVDPLDENTLLIGGIDLFRSTDGASSWTQISKWSNNNDLSSLSCSEVHADQHAITFRPGASNTVLFGNDGGVYYTSNLSNAANNAVIDSRNKDYNVTQFYACALSPTAGSNIMLAGAQDNGTQRYASSGINSTTEVYGGDGAYCFIDQNSPSTQIASYVYNNFYVSTNSGLSFFTSIIEDDATGKFINPADYDDVNNVLYSNKNSSSIWRVRNIGPSPATPETVTITGMADDASHIRVSPYSSTIFVGTDVGDIYKVTTPNGTPSSSMISKSNLPAGTVSCIEVGASENELLVTYFNYGIISVWYTNNGGTTWVSKEGNLPDMPIRWALFNPINRNEVILATELGVWSTTNFNATTPTWTASNNGMANVRVDMLQVRSSDNMVIAATHGRGLFSSLAFSLGAAPIPLFAANELVPCIGDTVTLSDTSITPSTSRNWQISPNTFTFIAGTNAGSQQAKVRFNAPGKYTIKLVLNNAQGSDSLTKLDYVMVGGFSLPFSENWENPTSVANWRVFNPDNATTWGIFQVSGNGTSTASAGVNNFDYQEASSAVLRDGLVSPLLNITNYSNASLTFKYAYARYAPQYMDSLAVYVSTDCGASWTRVASYSETQVSQPFGYITRADESQAFYPTTSTDWCGRPGYGACKTINLNAFVGSSIKIMFENISAYGNNLFIDDISVTGTAIVPAPVAAFSASAATACSNTTTLTFTDQSTQSPTSWLWSFTPNTVTYVNGTDSSSQNPQVRFNSSGAYSVTLTASNAAGSDNEVKNNLIAVNASVTPSIMVSTNDSIICSGGSASFTSSIQFGGTSPAYQWKRNNSNIGNNATLVSSSFTNGDSVYCILTSTEACATQSTVASNKIALTVNAKPSVVLTLPLAKFCLKDTAVVLTGGSPSGGIYTMQSNTVTSFNPNTLGIGNHEVTYTFTDANGCSNTSVRNITVTDVPPVPTITQNGNTLTCSVTGVTYRWFKNGSELAGANAKTYDITSSGVYEVEVTISGGCTNKSATFAATKTALQELAELKQIKVYPNPASSVANLSFNLLSTEKVRITLIDMQGKLVYERFEMLNQGQQQIEVPLTQVKPGNYLIQVSVKSGTWQQQLIVQ